MFNFIVKHWNRYQMKNPSNILNERVGHEPPTTEFVTCSASKPPSPSYRFENLIQMRYYFFLFFRLVGAIWSRYFSFEIFVNHFKTNSASLKSWKQKFHSVTIICQLLMDNKNGFPKLLSRIFHKHWLLHFRYI